MSPVHATRGLSPPRPALWARRLRSLTGRGLGTAHPGGLRTRHSRGLRAWHSGRLRSRSWSHWRTRTAGRAHGSVAGWVVRTGTPLATDRWPPRSSSRPVCRWRTTWRAHRPVSWWILRSWTTLAAHRRPSRPSLRVTRWSSRAGLLRRPGLHRPSRQASPRDNTLLRPVKTDAKSLLSLVRALQFYHEIHLPIHRHIHGAT